MGKEFSKISEVIWVSGAEISEIPQPESYEKKPLEVDYTKYKAKKFYDEKATEEDVAMHLQKLEKMESILKKFKYYEDFDRMHHAARTDSDWTMEYKVETGLKIGFLAALYFGRLIPQHFFYQYTYNGLWLRFTIKLFLFVTIPTLVYLRFTDPSYHIVNHDYFRTLFDEVSQRIQLEVDLDLYRDVEQMKYNTEYPTYREFHDLKEKLFLYQNGKVEGNISAYYLRKEGLRVNQYEQFVKTREQQRKTNKKGPIIDPKELELIKNQHKASAVV